MNELAFEMFSFENLPAAETSVLAFSEEAAASAPVNAVANAVSIPQPSAAPTLLFTNDQIANQLVIGTYADKPFAVAPGGTLTVNITGLTANGQFQARQALLLWTDVTGINFAEITGTAQITFDDNEPGGFASNVVVGNFSVSATINVEAALSTSSGPIVTGYTFFTFVHEIGHALGLGHGGNYNGTATYSIDALYLNDSYATTIMSYFDQVENTYFAGQGFTFAYPITPMPADILATTTLYGAYASTRTGNTQYGVGNTSGRGVYDAASAPNSAFTIIDHGGIDTLNYSVFSADQRINLTPETFSNIGGSIGNMSIARGTIIENAFGGSGNDTILGNEVANQLRGGAGTDTLIGLGGNDILVGEDGTDDLRGGDGNDVLIGGAGNDVLNGGAGSNELIGGAGEDTYDVSSYADSIVELASDAGYDRVNTALPSYVLPANVDDLFYTGTGRFVGLGNAQSNWLNGGPGRDELFGLDGDDFLYETNSAPGNEDTLIGGRGNDYYLVTLAGNSTIELPGEGDDTVSTSVSIYGLQANIENLTFSDNGTHAAGVGNVLANVMRGGTGIDNLFGRAGDDTLYGGTGAANTLLGQEGDDYYYVDAIGDSVVEFLNEGFDTVWTGLASFTLPINVERLLYTGTGNFTGIGSAGNNTLVGGSGADFLSGLDGIDSLTGGSGSDTLQGGAGADEFIYNGGETGFDRILDFVSGVDKIGLRFAGFNPTPGYSFASGPAYQPTGTSSIIFYNTSTNILSFDPDGAGAAAPIALAQFNVGQVVLGGDVFYFG